MIRAFIVVAMLAAFLTPCLPASAGHRNQAQAFIAAPAVSYQLAPVAPVITQYPVIAAPIVQPQAFYAPAAPLVAVPAQPVILQVKEKKRGLFNLFGRRH